MLPPSLGAWLGACREAEERPGLALDCNESACTESRGTGAPLPVPTAGGDDTDGGAGSGGGANMPGAGAGTLAGTVREVISSDLVSTRSLEGSVEVRALNESASGVVSAETGPGGMFRLDGIEQGSAVWVEAGAFEDPPVGPFIDTLQAVDSVRDNVVDLLVFRRDLLDDLAREAFVSTPVELDPAGAHVIVRFVRPDRTSIEGVRILFPDPVPGRIAYDNGSSYSDALDQTSVRGMAFLVNLSAATYPGTPGGISADIDGEQFTGPLQLVAGAVTVATLVLPDP